MKEIINVDPETGEVEEPTKMEKIKAGIKRHSGLVAGIIGVIVGTIAALVTMRNNESDEENEEEEESDAGEE